MHASDATQCVSDIAGTGHDPGHTVGHMCRNITELRGLEPPATDAEVVAAAEQFIRKVTGIGRPNPTVAAAMEAASRQIAQITTELLHVVPHRRQPPLTMPPLRRPEVRARLGLEPFDATAHGHTHPDGGTHT